MTTATDTADPTCAFHPDRATRLECTRCGRAACPECLRPVAVGQHCVNCLEGQPDASSGGKAAFALKSAVIGTTEQTRLRRPSALFLGICALFVGLCVALGVVGDSASTSGHAVRALAFSTLLLGAVLGTTLHEWAHAIVAYYGGDKTVVDKGYLTLDPRHYTDPILSIVMPLVFLVLGGLPLPGGAVWINHTFIRNKWWDSAVSLAGPATNFIFAAALIGITETGLLGHGALAATLVYLAFIEFAITFLNLLPIPGLDGYGIIEPHLPRSVQEALLPLRQFMFLILLVLVMQGNALSFLWTWSTDLCLGLGVNPFELIGGEALASPRLFEQ